MPLIISPKTTKNNIDIFTDVLGLRKIPKSGGKFWHGNFNEFFYGGADGLKVLFPGYSGPVTGYALIEYATKYKREDPKPEVYFVGSVYAFRDSLLEPGDLVYATDTFSPDSYERAIYKNAEGQGLKDFTKPDKNLLERFLKTAEQSNVKFKPTKVFCCFTPGYFPDFSEPTQLIDEAMWFKLSLAPIQEGGCDSGEYESAAVLATSKLLGFPAIALFDVKDKRYSPSDYRLATNEQKINAIHSILNTIKKTIG